MFRQIPTFSSKSKFRVAIAVLLTIALTSSVAKPDTSRRHTEEGADRTARPAAERTSSERPKVGFVIGWADQTFTYLSNGTEKDRKIIFERIDDPWTYVHFDEMMKKREEEKKYKVNPVLADFMNAKELTIQQLEDKLFELTGGARMKVAFVESAGRSGVQPLSVGIYAWDKNDSPIRPLVVPGIENTLDLRNSFADPSAQMNPYKFILEQALMKLLNDKIKKKKAKEKAVERQKGIEALEETLGL